MSVLYVFGTGWAWKERRLGYGIVLVVSAVAFARTFAVILGLGNPGLEAVFAAYTSEAVGVFFVFVYLAIALTSLMALFLSIYALAVRKRGWDPPRGPATPAERPAPPTRGRRFLTWTSAAHGPRTAIEDERGRFQFRRNS